jgi:site-specific recombinase XerC
VSQTIGYARVSPTTAEVLLAFERHLERANLADHTVSAYRRQAEAYLKWWDPGLHPDAFVDQVGAEAAVGAWRRHLLGEVKQAPASVNQALAAVSLLYEVGCRIRVKVKRARLPKPGEPDALTRAQERAVRRAADERGARDSAIIAVLFGCGARVEECARLDLEDVALTARTGTVRLFGKGDEVRTLPVTGKAHAKLGAWLLEHPGGTGLWVGQRGRLTISGVTKVVLAAGTEKAQAEAKPRAATIARKCRRERKPEPDGQGNQDHHNDEGDRDDREDLPSSPDPPRPDHHPGEQADERRGGPGRGRPDQEHLVPEPPGGEGGRLVRGPLN